MKILKLIIDNFKGIKKLAINFNGESLNIYGENATGKTTIADAIYWLLFGKDFRGKADFAIMPINKILENGYDDTTVTAIFELKRAEAVSFKRTLKSNYNKNNKLIGHTTDYYIDDEPYKEKDYKKYIEKICDATIFKILTNPYFFSSNSKEFNWTERRQKLFSLTENMPTDLEIIQQNEKLSPIINFIDKKTPDPVSSAKKILRDQKKKLRRSLDEIAASIKTLKKLLIKDIKENSIEIVKASIKHFQKHIDNLKAQKLQIENHSGLLEKKSELKEIQSNISQFILGWTTEHNKLVTEKEIELKRNEGEYNSELSISKFLEDEKKALEKIIYDMESDLAQLRQEWCEENQKEFMAVFDKISPNICPVCGKPFSENERQDVYEEAKKHFNKTKSGIMEEIQKKAKKIIEDKERTIEKMNKTNKKLETVEKNKELIIKKGEEAKKRILSIKEKKEKFSNAKKYKEYCKKERELEGIIQELSLGDNKKEIQKIQNEIEKFEEMLNEALNEKSRIEQRIEIENQINEHKRETKNLAEELESIEIKLILLSEFLKIKTSLIENKINDQFKLASFKLFRKKITDDEQEEICEVTDKNGIPFEKGLNLGAQINVGLDTINVLSEHYGFYPFIIIDNAEASTHIFETKNQQIRLYVENDCPELKFDQI